MPREGIYTCVFCPPPPLGDENPVMLHFFAYAEIIFAHILVFRACAIEVQHIDENSPTSCNKRREFKRETHTPLWLLIGRIIFLTREKTSFAILIGRIIFFMCENHRSLL